MAIGFSRAVWAGLESGRLTGPVDTDAADGGREVYQSNVRIAT
jgi:hypothetical protein